jgi:hypothetical protein
MEQRVHIVPMGWERDRIVLPIRAWSPDRVHLLGIADDDRSRAFLDLVRTDLMDLAERDDLRFVAIDRARAFDSYLMEAARVVTRESNAGNRVFVNISGSGNIAAAAMTLVGMYHMDRIGGLYYSMPQGYSVGAEASFSERGLSYGYAGNVDLPRFHLQRPRAATQRALAVLYEAGPLPLEVLIHRLHDLGVEPFDALDVPRATPSGVGARLERNRKLQAWLQRLRRLVLNEAIRDGLVTQTERGRDLRVRVELTSEGNFHALISGHVEGLRDVRP